MARANRVAKMQAKAAAATAPTSASPPAGAPGSPSSQAPALLQQDPAAPAAAVNPKGVPDPSQFAEFLPFMADAQPEIMMKDRCRGMLNRLLEKSGYDPQLTLKLLPKCHWAEDQCKQLQDDLVARIPKVGGPAAAPGAAALLQAPAPAAAKNFAGAPLLGDEVYGWCDTMWDMARANRVAKMQAKAAAATAPTSASPPAGAPGSPSSQAPALLQQDPVAPAAAVNPKGVPDPSQFAEFLPFMADAQPELMMKDRCRGMLNRLL